MKSNTRSTLIALRPAFWILFALLMTPVSLVAQVGHSPDASPYRHVRAKRVLALTGGYIWGETGDADVGPSNGVYGGARLDLLFSGPVKVAFNFWYADLERKIIDPTLPVAQRNLGTTRQTVGGLDGAVHLAFTGPKTWNGFAPYVGLGLGLAFGGPVTGDPSGFSFATKFLLVPQAGVRFFVSDRISLLAEGRDTMWRLSYPPSFFVSPGGGEPALLNSQTQKANEWTHHFTLMISLGYSFGY